MATRRLRCLSQRGRTQYGQRPRLLGQRRKPKDGSRPKQLGGWPPLRRAVTQAATRGRTQKRGRNIIEARGGPSMNRPLALN